MSIIAPKSDLQKGALTGEPCQELAVAGVSTLNRSAGASLQSTNKVGKLSETVDDSVRDCIIDQEKSMSHVAHLHSREESLIIVWIMELVSRLFL